MFYAYIGLMATVIIVAVIWLARDVYSDSDYDYHDDD